MGLVPFYRVQDVSGAVTAVSETLVWSSKWLSGRQWSQGFRCWFSVGAGCLHPVPMQVGVSQSTTNPSTVRQDLWGSGCLHPVMIQAEGRALLSMTVDCCLHPVPMQVGISQSSTVSVPTGCQRVELEYVDRHNPFALLCLSTQPGARG